MLMRKGAGMGGCSSSTPLTVAPQCLRSDGGKEYFSGQFNGYLQQMGIQRKFSCRYMAEQNGVAERKNRSILEAGRAMLEEKSFPKFYWAEAVRTAVYI